MIESGNVLILLKYYGTSSKRRAFYDSSDKNDYLEYVSQGINQNKVIDYIDYSGDEEKSSGVFNQFGLLSKVDKKKLREKLRNSKSCIWDMVISFKGEFGLNNMKDYQDALELINKLFPKFIKDTGLEMDNITWYAGLHTNTKTRHIHLSFFENEPRTHDRLTKGVKYRYGKLPIDAINNFKMNIEKHYMSPINQVAQLRKQAIEEAKNFIMSKSTTGKEKLIRKQIKYLFDYLPDNSYKAYGRKNMEPFRAIIDSISNYILETNGVNSLYLSTKEEVKKRDEELEMLYNFNHIKKDKRKYYGTTFETDLKTRMGNVIINEICNARMNIGKRTEGKKKKKSKTRYRKEEILNLIYQTFKHNLKVIDEASKVFEEYQKKLREAEFERLVEEGIIDHDGNLRNDSEMEM